MEKMANLNPRTLRTLRRTLRTRKTLDRTLRTLRTLVLRVKIFGSSERFESPAG
jgi:hypothetical protein